MNRTAPTPDLTPRQRDVLAAVGRGEVVRHPGLPPYTQPYDVWRPPVGRYARVTRTIAALSEAGLIEHAQVMREQGHAPPDPQPCTCGGNP